MEGMERKKDQGKKPQVSTKGHTVHAREGAIPDKTGYPQFLQVFLALSPVPGVTESSPDP